MENTKKYNRANVIQAISTVFPDKEKDGILAILDSYGREHYEHEKERVQLAIIKLSMGKVANLQDCVNLAKTDYRDILMSAEYNPDGSEIKNPYKVIGIR